MNTSTLSLVSLREFELGNGRTGRFHSLSALEAEGVGPVSKLPVSIRMVLESVLRNCDGRKVTEQNVRSLANWSPRAERSEEVPFIVARIVLQDFTGVPLLVDLAAMRSAIARMGEDPKVIEPLVPVDLVVDHSVQVDVSGTSDAFTRNLEIEFQRNRERYQLLKWGMQAFKTFKVVPPGIGIVHQVNLEYLAKGVLEFNGIYYPDTLVGTDSHTTMINGLGIVGWGVGGIEAEAGMLGQPVYFLTPDVVGVHLTGELREGVTATDLALTITNLLRQAKVVGKFVEFFGPGVAALPVVDRATIGNMAPEYGATMGFFPIDDECVSYLRATGRSEEHCKLYENYYKAQGLWGIPQKGDIAYSQELELELDAVLPSVAGPKRPQDRIELSELKESFASMLTRSTEENGFGRSSVELGKGYAIADGGSSTNGGGSQELISPNEARSRNTNPLTELEMANNHPTAYPVSVTRPPIRGEVSHGSVLIAAITSCTNTSNPSVMLAAGLLAKKAVEQGLRVSPLVKTSLAPGSRVVSEYLGRTGLQPYLDQLGFNLVGYGCTTCIGNSGPLHPAIEKTTVENDLITASVLSGNRNFEARIHQSIKANFLMSPPLVVAFALAGRVDIDMSREPIGKSKNGADIFLRDLWPTMKEIRKLMQTALKPDTFRRLYQGFASQNPKWSEIPSKAGNVYEWDTESTYIQEPPFFDGFSMELDEIQEIANARALAVFGDSVTTDHISPAGAIKKASPAGEFLIGNGIEPAAFNSYGSRRGNDRIMTRGTFANVRIKNLMVPGVEGGVTKFQPSGEQMNIYDAARKYRQVGVPLIVLAGQEYGTGSSRDWAAKGTALLGVKAVIAQSFERIHRSNLVGMGVLPLQFQEGMTVRTLGLNGTEIYDIVGFNQSLKPRQDLMLKITRQDGSMNYVNIRCRIDTPVEIDYFRNGGILPYVLRQLVKECHQ